MTRFQSLLIENLKRERKRAGYSQEKLAELADLSPKYISALEIGNRFPSPETFQKLIEILNIEPYQLFLDPSKPTRDTDINMVKSFQDFLAKAYPAFLHEATQQFIDRE